MKLENSNGAREVIIVGGGIAGLSAAIYLGRAQRDALVVDNGKSMAQWEPQVQNYLGFPEGVAGEDLLRKGAEQARNYGVEIIDDEIVSASRGGKLFHLRGKVKSYSASRVLLATGLFHLPPKIDGVDQCLGHS
ncbi:MAG TPA: NAD(P)/FAD-dependent oxidoreductase, partial [Verrucomicrobiae bacterium]|nr:NAD(P)/FAD-dependent oxidoreductase [Verrucomicrobiae bacterium]